MHQTIFQLQCFVLLNNHQYNCNITKSFLSAAQSYLQYLQYLDDSANCKTDVCQDAVQYSKGTISVTIGVAFWSIIKLGVHSITIVLYINLTDIILTNIAKLYEFDKNNPAKSHRVSRDHSRFMKQRLSVLSECR